MLAERDTSGSTGIHHWAGSWLDLGGRLGFVENYIRNGHFVAAAARLDAMRAANPDSEHVVETFGLLYPTVAATIVKAMGPGASPSSQ